jgi:hypothetical protein
MDRSDSPVAFMAAELNLYSVSVIVTTNNCGKPNLPMLTCGDSSKDLTSPIKFLTRGQPHRFRCSVFGGSSQKL